MCRNYTLCALLNILYCVWSHFNVDAKIHIKLLMTENAIAPILSRYCVTYFLQHRRHRCVTYYQVISAELRSSKHWDLTVEGREVVEQGSHEARVFSCIPPDGFPHSELMASTYMCTQA